jgi:hypothetical protein
MLRKDPLKRLRNELRRTFLDLLSCARSTSSCPSSLNFATATYNKADVSMNQDEIYLHGGEETERKPRAEEPLTLLAEEGNLVTLPLEAR